MIIVNDYLDWILNKTTYVCNENFIENENTEVIILFNTLICTSLTALGHKKRNC